MYNVVTTGIMVADIIVKPVNRFPDKGTLDLIDSAEMFSGGNAMTVAINMSKMGLNAAVIGKIGNDPLGDFLVNCLKNYNVTTAGVVRSDEAQTSASVVISSDDGERSFLHCKGANGKLRLKDVNFDLINQTDIVFVTGSFIMNDFDGNDTVEFLKECKHLGKTTALDVCWDSNANTDWLINDAMPYIDLFMPSIDEAKMIAGTEDVEEMAKIFIEHGAGSAIIKCGSDGCYIKEDKDKAGVKVKAIYVENAVDTTGAGDSFCSGFLAAYSKGYNLYECAEIGNAVGACCVMKKGATSGTLSFEETLNFLEENK